MYFETFVKYFTFVIVNIYISKMNDRIAKVIEYYKFSPSEFADEIEVPRSSISHITSGRNRPSLDFITKVKDKFPNLSWDWLIYGEGEMHTKPENKKIAPSDLFSIIENENFGKEPSPTLSSYNEVEETPRELNIPNEDTKKTEIRDSQQLEFEPRKEELKTIDNQQNKIKKIILLYENGKFESFEP